MDYTAWERSEEQSTDPSDAALLTSLLLSVADKFQDSRSTSSENDDSANIPCEELEDLQLTDHFNSLEGSPFGILYYDVLLIIFSKFTYESLISISRVCKLFYILSQHNHLWFSLYYTQFLQLPHLPILNDHFLQQWKEREIQQIKWKNIFTQLRTQLKSSGVVKLFTDSIENIIHFIDETSSLSVGDIITLSFDNREGRVENFTKAILKLSCRVLPTDRKKDILTIRPQYLKLSTDVMTHHQVMSSIAAYFESCTPVLNMDRDQGVIFEIGVESKFSNTDFQPFSTFLIWNDPGQSDGSSRIEYLSQCSSVKNFDIRINWNTNTISIGKINVLADAPLLNAASELLNRNISILAENINSLTASHDRIKEIISLINVSRDLTLENHFDIMIEISQKLFEIGKDNSVNQSIIDWIDQFISSEKELIQFAICFSLSILHQSGKVNDWVSVSRFILRGDFLHQFYYLTRQYETGNRAATEKFYKLFERHCTFNDTQSLVSLVSKLENMKSEKIKAQKAVEYILNWYFCALIHYLYCKLYDFDSEFNKKRQQWRELVLALRYLQ